MELCVVFRCSKKREMKRDREMRNKQNLSLIRGKKRKLNDLRLLETDQKSEMIAKDNSGEAHVTGASTKIKGSDEK
uniref:Uncharacterized protein n=1 Tax=Romanomermis culicivorax TaxID=13658 RepID=A0A915IM64_ROMCU